MATTLNIRLVRSAPRLTLSMMSLLQLFLLGVAVSHAVAAAAAATCSSDLDCQLNGVCQSGTCHCDAAWSGASCESLRLSPGHLAYAPEDATAWGGGPPVLDPITGKWVLFVTEIALHCGKR